MSFEQQRLPHLDAMGAASKAEAPLCAAGGGEKSARRQAREARMAFRIAKGYEKDNLLTRLKYWLKDR